MHWSLYINVGSQYFCSYVHKSWSCKKGAVKKRIFIHFRFETQHINSINWNLKRKAMRPTHASLWWGRWVAVRRLGGREDQRIPLLNENRHKASVFLSLSQLRWQLPRQREPCTAASLPLFKQQFIKLSGGEISHILYLQKVPAVPFGRYGGRF